MHNIRTGNHQKKKKKNTLVNKIRPTILPKLDLSHCCPIDRHVRIRHVAPEALCIGLFWLDPSAHKANILLAGKLLWHDIVEA